MAEDAIWDEVDDFNSSDVADEDDWDRTIFAKKSTIGKRQAETILANQVADRAISKRNYRKLEFHKGAPTSQEARIRVEVLWDRFYAGLGVDVASCPTGESIFRFIDTLTRHVKTNIRGKDVASLSAILSMWEHLNSILTFRFADLKEHYGSRDVLRINVHLDQLVKRGILFKGTWFKKQWVGYLVVKKIAESWLAQNLAEGCLSWDRTLYKAFGLILQSGLAARCGDIGRSARYDGMQYLSYGDIELTLRQSLEGEALSVQSLSGRFVLRFRKGKKDVVHDDDTLFVDALQDRTQNATCMIKMLLIVALRFGHVHGTSLSEVLQHTSMRHDRIVQWKYPKRPVLCQMRTWGSLELEKPAPAQQLTNSLRQMALVAGILDRVVSHDVRRGAMRDVAYLKKSIAGVGTAAAALIAGHSRMSEAQGITNRYVGALQVPVFNLRAEAGFVDRLAPRFASSPVQLRPSTRLEVDAYMDEHGMDKSKSRKRARAGELLKELQIEKWKASEIDRLVEPVAKLPRLQVNRAEIGRGKTITGASTSMISRSNPQPKPLSEMDPNQDIPQFGQLSGNPDHVEKDPNIDPYLYDLDNDENDGNVDQAAFEALESLVLGGDTDAEESATDGRESDTLLRAHALDTAAMDDALIQVSLDPGPSAPLLETDPLLLEPDRFVDWFASINVVRTCRGSSKIIGRQPEGNSRDAPTSFLFHCGLGDCKVHSPTMEVLVLHQLNCDGSPPTEKKFPCLEAGCGRSFGNALSLATHMNDTHNFQPRPCSQCLDSDTLYQNINELRVHQDAVHNIFEEPMQCPLPCDGKTRYTHPSTLRKHLAAVHHQTVDQIKELVQAKKPKARPKTSFACPVPGCTSLKTIPHSGVNLRLHLTRRHNYTQEEALELVPETKLGLTSKAKKVNAEPKPPPPTWKCPVDDCTSASNFEANRTRRKHLRGVHKWTEEQTMEYVPLSKREITSAKNRVANDEAMEE